MLKLILTRRSIREWNSKPVSDVEIRHLLEAAMNAPSAMNEQAWQFIILRGEVLEKVNADQQQHAQGCSCRYLGLPRYQGGKGRGVFVAGLRRRGREYSFGGPCRLGWARFGRRFTKQTLRHSGKY
jgi:nitroreductase